ncbi:glycosyltransferase family 2 protein [Propionicimonas sp.]|uniref:glycosyltransferase family 2 protein n=1 Tax=Propionicimonas sp. TaxID=1955623 RepID=UPI0039E5106B
MTIVVPAKNEARNLEVVLPLLPDVHQILVVDGHSVDDTVAVARSVRPGVEVITQTRKGKGNALVCGFEHATGDIIVMFDADGSADPDEIPAFVDALLAGADVAKGTRFAPGGGSDDITRIRRAGNWCLNGLVNLLLGARFSDLCYGYNAFWRRVVPDLRLPATRIDGTATDTMLWGDGFEIETVLNCRFSMLGLAITEVPSVEKLRIFGESNLHAVSDGLRVLRTVIDERLKFARLVQREDARSSGTPQRTAEIRAVA